VMISATNDEHIQKCFEKVNKVKIDDYTPFEVAERTIIARTRDDIDMMAVNETYDIIQRMANEEVDPGHMIVFTSGNESMKSLKNKLTKMIAHQVENKTERQVRIIEVSSANVSVVEKRIDSEFKGKDTLFIVFILYNNITSDNLREFIQKPCISNVIKVVFTINAVESSIFVDNLAAVIDCGLSSQPFYDERTGIRRISEGPASVQSQNIRRGHTGRFRNGTVIRITQKDQKF